MAKKPYQTMQDKQTDWGYFTVGPFPKKKTASEYADEIRKRYMDVFVEKGQYGYMVKYRGPRK